MKYLLLCVTIFLLSCSKPQQPTISVSGDDYAYYKITQVDFDGKTTSTPVKYVKLNSNTSKDILDYNGDGDHDGDDDDDDDHHTVPIIFESFTLNLISSNLVQVNWSATNEQNVDHYILERSNDAITWNQIINVNVSTDGTYSVIDKF